MAYHLFGAKLLPETMLFIVNRALTNEPHRNWNQNKKYFINENAFEDIFCKMAAILSRGEMGILCSPCEY